MCPVSSMESSSNQYAAARDLLADLSGTWLKGSDRCYVVETLSIPPTMSSSILDLVGVQSTHGLRLS